MIDGKIVKKLVSVDMLMADKSREVESKRNRIVIRIDFIDSIE